MKYLAVRLLDWFDEKTHHRMGYWFCHFISVTLESWWPEPSVAWTSGSGTDTIVITWDQGAKHE